MFDILNKFTKLNNYLYFNNIKYFLYYQMLNSNLLNIDPLNINPLNNEMLNNKQNDVFTYSIYQLVYTFDIINNNNITFLYS
jgi:hypothetical protein